MATVNISVQPGGLMVVPPVITLTPADQTITWKLLPGNSGWEFSSSPAGVVCDRNPPSGSGYDPWPTAATDPSGDATTYTANANTPGPPARKLYKYSFILVKGSQKISWDPDIENQP